MKYNIKPLFVKDTKGESMPSRHVFSITIIAMCWLYVSVPVGIIMLMLVEIMAASRVLAGVHFVRDAVAGFSSRNYMWNCRLMDYSENF